MSFFRYLQKFQFIDRLIRTRKTGTQKELAKKADLSVSTLNEYLNTMKELGFPIKYCSKSRCYYYEKEGKMVESFFIETLSKEELKQRTGGQLPPERPTKTHWQNECYLIENNFSHSDYIRVEVWSFV